MKFAARQADYRSYRDAISKDFMGSIGLDASADPIYPDIAFSLPAPKVAAPAPTGMEPLTVGVGVMAYYGWRGSTGQDAGKIYNAYLQKIATFVLWLVDRRHPVRILVGETTDRQAINDLLNTLERERPGFPRDYIVAEGADSLHELMRQIAQTHVVVATRFHNIVCALKLCKPAVSIGYAKKNDVLMAEMGLGEFCQHVEQLDVDLLVKQFLRVVSNWDCHVQIIRKVNEDYMARLACQQRILLDKIV
jgi:polysaccharide pyruvyl transferase WcaK-like protein